MKQVGIFLTALIGASFLPNLAMAYSSAQMADQFFSNTKLPLSSQEKTALALGQQWQKGGADSKPVAGSNGAVQFVFGGGQTPIDCAVLQVCDIALQPGEQVNNVNVGDPRFTIEPAITGYGPTQTLHLLIKPLDVGLDTSLVVTTNRRTYHLRLRSFRNKFMPFVSFIYPQDLKTQWAHLVQTRAANTLPGTQEYLGNLDFHYAISGSASWKPVRVYNDGVKTIIQMPSTLSQSEAPVLLVIRQDGGLFSPSQQAMVNYRVQDDRYIVDSIFSKAILIAGVGGNQEKITITKES